MLGTRIKFKQRLANLKENKENIVCFLESSNSSLSCSHKSQSVAASTPVKSLGEILKATPWGQSILQQYKEHCLLLDEHREALVNIIVQHFSERSIPMTMRDIINFSEQIILLFPIEDLRYYCNKRSGKNPTGKLYDKATNVRRKMKRGTQVKDAQIDISSYKITKQTETQTEDEDALGKKIWLSHNVEPWSVVEQNWRDTIALRIEDVKNKSKNVLIEWPLLKHSLGYSLIEIDFELKYPGKSQSLFTEWPNFTTTILPYMNEKVKDSASKNLLAKIETSLNDDSKDCIITLLLHAVLKPSMISVQQANAGKRLKWKPSIGDAQNATVLHCECINDYQRLYEELKLKAMGKELPLQPIILVIGPDIASLASFCILFDGILYKVPTFLKALDTIFKLFHVLNFEYPAEAKNLYTFIQHYFFDIECIATPNIVLLTSYLQTVK
ncbi:uncharacterized protein [Eurosta solidaginis]|uniref:uncharacterized protein isoform X1 n=1 Tax=Eurosta solidaginis TaxID=178769 RepID=UPI003530D1E5